MTKKRLTQTTRANKKKSLPPNVYIQPRTLADGTTKGVWIVRKRVTISGHTKTIERTCKANNLTAYKDALKQINFELNGSSKDDLEHRDKTFGDLADYYEKIFLVPALFSNGQKVNRGLRHTYNPRMYLTGYGNPLQPGEKRKPLKGPNLGWRALIGDRTKLNSISGRHLIQLKEDLFVKYPIEREKWFPLNGKRKGEKRLVTRVRSFTDVDRRLEVLRRMFSIARLDLKWMTKNPFQDSSTTLIEIKKETWRKRLMSDEEEEALLKVALEERCRKCEQKSKEAGSTCEKDEHRAYRVKDREHLKLIVTGLVDTCMRSGEFFKLTVGDWREREITVQQWTTKTSVERIVPASLRFIDLIRAWIKDNELTDDDWLLTRRSVQKMIKRKNQKGMADHVESCRSSWRTAIRLTGIKDLRPRDLRRTGATRLLRAGLAMAEISQILGHTSIEMTMRYIGVDKTSIVRAANVLDARHAARTAELAQRDAAMAVN